MLRQELTCNTNINYTEVIGDRILPFLIVLDLANSVLSPAPGENQRFCYDVIGMGSDAPEYADLSHLVLGICEQITEAQIVNISVFIDGVEQEITFGSGGNVELKTPEAPDPPTGCPGLKFNFPLNKITGQMNLCFELTTPYSVGPNVVCLFGGETTANSLSICGPFCEVLGVCEVTGYQQAGVCVPVTVTPFAYAGTTTTFCCGPPIITPGTNICGGTLNGSCHFTMLQDVCMAVPVKFGARAFAGDPSVECEDATSEDVCTNCGETLTSPLNAPCSKCKAK